MREHLLAILEALERKFPPPNGSHHCITLNRFGSDAEGWEKKLGLHIALAGHGPSGLTFRTFFLEREDFERPVEDLVEAVRKEI